MNWLAALLATELVFISITGEQRDKKDTQRIIALRGVEAKPRSGHLGPYPYSDEQAFDEDGTCFPGSGMDKWCWLAGYEELKRTWDFILGTSKKPGTSTAPPKTLLKYHIRIKPLGTAMVKGTTPGFQLLVKYESTDGRLHYMVLTIPWEPNPALPNGYEIDEFGEAEKSSGGPFIPDRPWNPSNITGKTY